MFVSLLYYAFPRNLMLFNSLILANFVLGFFKIVVFGLYEDL